jgi:hypothetical protein
LRKQLKAKSEMILSLEKQSKKSSEQQPISSSECSTCLHNIESIGTLNNTNKKLRDETAKIRHKLKAELGLTMKQLTSTEQVLSKTHKLLESSSMENSRLQSCLIASSDRVETLNSQITTLNDQVLTLLYSKDTKQAEDKYTVVSNKPQVRCYSHSVNSPIPVQNRFEVLSMEKHSRELSDTLHSTSSEVSIVRSTEAMYTTEKSVPDKKSKYVEGINKENAQYDQSYPE